MQARRGFGLIILLLVILAVLASKLFGGDGDPPDPTPLVAPTATALPDITVYGLTGGKELFFRNPEIVRILRDRYHLTVNFTRVGSPEMVRLCGTGYDYCFASNETSAAQIKSKLGAAVLGSKIIFHTPIVFYSRHPVVDALIAQ